MDTFWIAGVVAPADASQIEFYTDNKQFMAL